MDGTVAGAATAAAGGGAPAGVAAAAVQADALQRAADAVARLGASSADYDALSDADALAGQKAIAQAQHELDTRKAWMAKTLAHRSRWELGQAGLAKQRGFLSPEDLIQNLTGTTRAESRKLVGVGQMLGESEAAAAAAADAEAEAARRLLDEALAPDSPDADDTGDPTAALPVPEPVPLPWHAPISRSVSEGTLSIDAAHALRTGLGDIDTVVTGPILAHALADLLAEAPRLNADQLLKRARHTRDCLDEAGIRVREQKTWDDRYLHIWTLNTGQVRIDGLFPPEQGEFIKATFDSLTSPRRGGVRFVDTERANWARRVQNDPRTTTQITCDGFVGLLKAGTTINPNEMLGGRRPAVQIITTTPATRPTRPAADTAVAPTAGTGTGAGTTPDTGSHTGPTADTSIEAHRPNRESWGGGGSGGAGGPVDAPEPAHDADVRPPREPEEHPPDRTDAPCRLDGLFPVEFLRTADDILICEPGQGGHGYLDGNTAPVSAETIERLICDSGSVDIRFDDLGRPLDVGRDERLFNPDPTPRPRRPRRRLPLARLRPTTRIHRSPPPQPLAAGSRHHRHRPGHPALPRPSPAATQPTLADLRKRRPVLAQTTGDRRPRPDPHRDAQPQPAAAHLRKPRAPQRVTTDSTTGRLDHRENRRIALPNPTGDRRAVIGRRAVSGSRLAVGA